MLFKNVFVYGDSLQDYIVAIVVLEDTEVKKWLAREDIEYTNYDTFIKKNEFKELLLKKLSEFKQSAGFNSLEIPKKIHIHDEEFTPENGLLTPTFKLKRTDAKTYFLKQIKLMYGNASFQGES